MRDDKGQTQGVAAIEDQARSVWSAPQLTVIDIYNLTQAGGNVVFESDFVNSNS